MRWEALLMCSLEERRSKRRTFSTVNGLAADPLVNSDDWLSDEVVEKYLRGSKRGETALLARCSSGRRLIRHQPCDHLTFRCRIIVLIMKF